MLPPGTRGTQPAPNGFSFAPPSFRAAPRAAERRVAVAVGRGGAGSPGPRRRRSSLNNGGAGWGVVVVVFLRTNSRSGAGGRFSSKGRGKTQK